jgi:hypothetical protein
MPVSGLFVEIGQFHEVVNVILVLQVELVYKKVSYRVVFLGFSI